MRVALLLGGLLAVLAVGCPADAAWATSGSGPASGTAAPLPPAPAGVTVQALSCTATAITVRISWAAAAGADGYVVRRQVAGQAPSVVTTTSSTRADDTVTLGNVVSYTVQSALSTWSGGTSSPVAAPLTC